MQKFKMLFILALVSRLAPATVIHVPADQPSIQAGIKAAADGDTVLVAEGQYKESIDFSGKKIVVASLFVIDQENAHIEKTITSAPKDLDPDKGSIVSFLSGETNESALIGFTLTGGTGTTLSTYQRGGGAIIVDRAAPTIAHNIIMNNSVKNTKAGYTMGGGICVTMSDFKAFTIIDSNTVSRIAHRVAAHRSMAAVCAAKASPLKLLSMS